MQQQNIPIGTLVDMYKRGELHLPKIQRHDIRRAGFVAGCSMPAFQVIQAGSYRKPLKVTVFNALNSKNV